MDNCVDLDPTDYAMGDYDAKEVEINSKLPPEEYVQQLVTDNRIVVFSKSQCPHCDHSKNTLSDLGVDYKAVELDKLEQGSEVQSTLGEITDAKTVPRIFINGKCVGGNSDLQNLNKSGELLNQLQKGNPPLLQ